LQQILPHLHESTEYLAYGDRAISKDSVSQGGLQCLLVALVAEVPISDFGLKVLIFLRTRWATGQWLHPHFRCVGALHHV